MKRRILLAAAATALTFAATALGVAQIAVAAGPSHTKIVGDGSSWAFNAVYQWESDVTATGLQVAFTSTGSAQGRRDFANDTTDFGVTDIGYQGHDPLTGDEDTNCPSSNHGICRAFAYEPLVAGGTSFPYQIKVGGQLIRNLRLSGLTLAKIFTYQITNWDDPAITADNNGRKLPSLPITPVEHSEGSGSTAQFTTWMATQYPSIWASIGRDSSGHVSKFTEYYPSPGSHHAVQQNGSDGVMNFVSSSAANGAIAYDEYSYPLQKNFPTARIENKAGYFVLPDKYNVAVALTHAIINMDKSSPNYLLQDLHNVYSSPEPQAYPLSSYSYFLIPTGTSAQDHRITTAKRQTLADYLYYSICEGQQEIGPIGYSPLPINLVQASFQQTALLKKADPNVDLTSKNVTSCNNPTFDPANPNRNRLAEIAPIPPICDRSGHGPELNTGGCGASGNGIGGGSGGTGSGGGSGAGSGNGAGATKATGTAAGNGSAGGAFGDSGGSGGDAGNASNAAQPLPPRSSNLSDVLGPLAVLELLAVLVLPPIAYYYVTNRRRKRT